MAWIDWAGWPLVEVDVTGGRDPRVATHGALAGCLETRRAVRRDRHTRRAGRNGLTRTMTARSTIVGAVREGRDIYLDGEDELIDALSFLSPLSLPYALEQLVPRLVSAIDGGPATKVAEAT